ncbi:MAG: phosphoadenosine phosphosulfate reductase family protein [Clostridiales bacterium]|nr:phosphoadenosine phosphosulfate reductase family protein [Clostridiales bacterium]
MENEFLLQDRLQKIKQIIHKYGEENFYISFSGGKDSTVLSVLVDMALPDNKIPRVYANTGIELNMIRDWVFELQKKDDRIVVIKPSKSIKDTLEEYGYPFKSKKHSKKVGTFQRHGMTKTAEHYLTPKKGEESFACPALLRYQFTDEFKLKVDYLCCVKMKEEPMQKWAKENNKSYAIIGIMRDEGGGRTKSKCLVFDKKKLKSFQPLSPMTKSWEEWFIDKYKVEICAIYYPPYNFLRTGCKGCPNALKLQQELDTLEKFFPNERKQCEYIWKPVYDEYRRIGYRLRPLECEKQMSIDDFVKGVDHIE